jgi:hypothetical protein
MTFRLEAIRQKVTPGDLSWVTKPGPSTCTGRG